MAQTSSEDWDLVREARHDREAFGQLFERYFDRIYNYLYYRTGNHHEAEDLTALVFMRAIRHIGTYKVTGAPFNAWLYRIARNLVANWYRDRSKRQVIALESLAGVVSGDSPEAAAQVSAENEELLEAIRRLPADRQELLILKFTEGFSNAEIGQVLGRTEGAVKSLYHRTLISLKEDMVDIARRQQQKKQQSHQQDAGRIFLRRRKESNKPRQHE